MWFQVFFASDGFKLNKGKNDGKNDNAGIYTNRSAYGRRFYLDKQGYQGAAVC